MNCVIEEQNGHDGGWLGMQQGGKTDTSSFVFSNDISIKLKLPGTRDTKRKSRE